VFPRDHGAHPAFRTEWWYLTGWLETAAGRTFGFQITFFRSRPGVAEDLTVPVAARQLVLAHAALADPRRGHLLHEERTARAAFGLAGTREDRFEANLDDWSFAMPDDTHLTSRIVAREFSFDLQARLTQPLMLQGPGGISRKGPKPREASFYVSLPQLAVSGRIEAAGERHAVSGSAWFDHEWSSQYLPAGVTGWDWTGLNLDDGSALMVFRMRDREGRAVWAGGQRRLSDGRAQAFAPDQIRFSVLRTWRSPRSGALFPVSLRIEVPGLRLELHPLMDDQELDARAGIGIVYWEGAVEARSDGRRAGRGYLELTGYAGDLRL
jgi:predicted secreted hydrolase